MYTRAGTRRKPFLLHRMRSTCLLIERIVHSLVGQAASDGYRSGHAVLRMAFVSSRGTTPVIVFPDTINHRTAPEPLRPRSWCARHSHSQETPDGENRVQAH